MYNLSNEKYIAALGGGGGAGLMGPVVVIVYIHLTHNVF